MKLIVYSHDAFGLGNIRRMLAICQHLLKAFPGISILVVSGSPALHSLRLPMGLDYIKLPCLRRDQAGQLAAHSHASVEETLRLRSGLILTAVTHFAPDILLVDKKPDGLQGELHETLIYLQVHRPQTHLVLLLRDILDRPEVTRHQWQRHGYHDLIRRLYSQVWVVGTPGVFDMCAEYQFPACVVQKVRFCGYIRRELGLKSLDQVRSELAMSAGQRLLLVTLGGGGDGYRLADTYLSGLAVLPLVGCFKSLLILGSEMPEGQCWELKQRAAAQSDVVVLEFTDDLMSYLAAAELVVAMGGYNTICEILTLGKRSIIVPRIEPVAEQWIRADRMEKLGWLRVIHPHHLTPTVLMAAVQQDLDSSQSLETTTPQLNMEALPQITRYLTELLQHPHPMLDAYSTIHSPMGEDMQFSSAHWERLAVMES